PEHLLNFWRSLKQEERLELLQEEHEALAKAGLVAGKKTWCLCKYCKHRRLRLSDVYELLAKVYFEDIDALLRGGDPAEPSSYQLKTRNTLYRSLVRIAEDALNPKSRLMLDSLERLGRAF